DRAVPGSLCRTSCPRLRLCGEPGRPATGGRGRERGVPGGVATACRRARAGAAVAAHGGQEHGLQPVPRQCQAAVHRRRTARVGERGRAVRARRGRGGRRADLRAHRPCHVAGGGPGTAHARRLARAQAERGGAGSGLLDRRLLRPAAPGQAPPGARDGRPAGTRRGRPAGAWPGRAAGTSRGGRAGTRRGRSAGAWRGRRGEPRRRRSPGYRPAGRSRTRPPKGAIAMTKSGGGLRYRRRSDVMDLLARARPASLDPGQGPRRQAAEIARLAAAGTAPAGAAPAGTALAGIAPAGAAPAGTAPAVAPRPGRLPRAAALTAAALTAAAVAVAVAVLAASAGGTGTAPGGRTKAPVLLTAAMIHQVARASRAALALSGRATIRYTSTQNGVPQESGTDVITFSGKNWNDVISQTFPSADGRRAHTQTAINRIVNGQ